MALIRHATLFSFLLSNFVLFGQVGAEWSSSWAKFRSLLVATDVEQQGLDDGSFLLAKNNHVARDFGDFADEDEEEYLGGGDVGGAVVNEKEANGEADESPKPHTLVRELKKGRNKVRAPVGPRAPVAGRQPKPPKNKQNKKKRSRKLKKGGGGRNKVRAPVVPRAPVVGRQPKPPKNKQDKKKKRSRKLADIIQE